MTWLYASEMMNTVAAVASAMYKPSCVCTPRARNASSGPYAEDERPSAPNPTHARNAASAMCWRVLWLNGSSGAPITSARSFSYVFMATRAAPRRCGRVVRYALEVEAEWPRCRKTKRRMLRRSTKTLPLPQLLGKPTREHLHFLQRLLVALAFRSGDAVPISCERVGFKTG